MRVLELGEVAGKFHLQFRRRARVTKTLQSRNERLEQTQAAGGFFGRACRRRSIRFAPDQLTAGRDAHPAENSLCLADLDPFRREIDVSAKSFQLRLLDLAGDGRKRDGKVAVANVERVQKRLMMKKGRVIDIERDLAHDRERLVTFFVVVNADVARDQPAERIERQAADGGFDPAFVQLLDDFLSPAAAETFLGQIPAAGQKPDDDQDGRQAPEGQQNPQARGKAHPSAMQPPSRRFTQHGRRHADSYGRGAGFQGNVIRES